MKPRTRNKTSIECPAKIIRIHRRDNSVLVELQASRDENFAPDVYVKPRLCLPETMLPVGIKPGDEITIMMDAKIPVRLY